MFGEWISVENELPNEDEIIYNGVGNENERHVSDRVLTVDANGFIRTGYFMKSASKHKYHGKGRKNEYSDIGFARWEFEEHYQQDPSNWVCGKDIEIDYWMPLPKPPCDLE